jgi:hypothetical protein
MWIKLIEKINICIHIEEEEDNVIYGTIGINRGGNS